MNSANYVLSKYHSPFRGYINLACRPQVISRISHLALCELNLALYLYADEMRGEAIVLVDEMNSSADHKLTVFTEALQLPAHERAAYVERACNGDVELRRAVEALLQEYDLVGDFMEESPHAPRMRSCVPPSRNCWQPNATPSSFLLKVPHP